MHFGHFVINDTTFDHFWSNIINFTIFLEFFINIIIGHVTTITL